MFESGSWEVQLLSRHKACCSVNESASSAVCGFVTTHHLPVGGYLFETTVRHSGSLDPDYSALTNQASRIPMRCLCKGIGHKATRHVFDTVALAGDRWEQSVMLAFTLRIALANAENDARIACIELSRR